MKLTTMKISVPVLMLMMFQSGYGVSDWFAKAWSAMNQGKTAEAFAVVQQQKPEKVGKLSAEQAIEFKKDWSKAVSDAVTNVLPLYYADKMGSGEEGEALRDAMIKLGNDGIMTSGKYATLDDTAGLEINTANVNRILQGRIVATANIPTNNEWLLPDENLVHKYKSDDDADNLKTKNQNRGILAWAGRLATVAPEDVQKALKKDEGADTSANDPCKINLRDAINLTDGTGGAGVDDYLTQVNAKIATSVGDARTYVTNAGNTVNYDDTSIKTLASDLKEALLDVLAKQIAAADDTGKKTFLVNYIKVLYDRVVSDQTTTSYTYADATGNDDTNAFNEILRQISKGSSISDAIKNVISADLSLLLRHTGSVNVDTLDNAIASSNVATGLESVAQTFDDATASSIVSNLKAIKNN